LCWWNQRGFVERGEENLPKEKSTRPGDDLKGRRTGGVSATTWPCDRGETHQKRVLNGEGKGSLQEGPHVVERGTEDHMGAKARPGNKPA